MVILSVAAQQVSSGTITITPSLVDIGDFYWADGRKVHLSRVAGELLVRLAPSADPKRFVREVAGGTGALVGFKPSVIFDKTTLGFSGPPDQLSDVDAVFDQLRKINDVVWVGPVFFNVETGSRLWVTDRVVAALKPGVDPHEIFGSGFAEYHRLSGTPDQYVATVVVGGGSQTLDAANRLNAIPGVAWASPNFYQDVRTWKEK